MNSKPSYPIMSNKRRAAEPQATAQSVWSAPHPGAFGWPRILRRPKRRDAAHSKRFARPGYRTFRGRRCYAACKQFRLLRVRAMAWKLGAQAVAVSCLLATGTALAQGPAPAKAPNLDWSPLACSADARVIVATAGGLSRGYIPSLVYVSTNGGLGWSAAPLPGCIWGAVACSADGTCLAAAVHDHVTASE